MSTIVKWFAKKYVISIINDVIEAAKSKVDIETWKLRVKNVIAFCNLLLETLDDDKLTAEEADKIIDSATKLIS